MANSKLLSKCSLKESWLFDYTLVEFISSGSYGGVYKAEHKITKLKSAIKITYLQKLLLDGGASTENVNALFKKMNREFLLIAGKQHLNIVNVYDGLEVKLQEENIEELMQNVTNAKNIDAKHVRNNLEYWAAKTGLDALFIRMELCGITLRQWIDTSEHEGVDLWINQITIINNILNGLKFLHENKILHRDLKSENILITVDYSSNYCAKIGDFGMGRIVHSDESKTSAQTMKPRTTPLYKAPELETGNEYTLQADLYSLGLIMFEIIKMLNSNDRKVEFSRITTQGINVDLPRDAFENARAVILNLVESDTKYRLKTVGQVKLKSPDEVRLGKKEYSGGDLEKIFRFYRVLIGDPEGGSVVTGGAVSICNNLVIRNVVFGSSLSFFWDKDNVSFAADLEASIISLGFRVKVILNSDRSKMSNVVAVGNPSIKLSADSRVGHRIQSISLPNFLIHFSLTDSTSSSTSNTSSLDRGNRILTNGRLQ